MGNGLEGKRIVFGGSRKVEEICSLIDKQGGTPVIRSLQGTVFLADKEIEPDLKKIVNEGADWVIFTTGMGLDTLIKASEKVGMKEKFLQIIRHAKVASRGYKTLAALKKVGITPIASDDDGTSKGLMRSLEKYDFFGQKVMLQLHGETAPELTKFFEDKGATVLKILPYQHIAPETKTVFTLCHELRNQKVDAVCFTTAIQVRSLFDFSRKHGLYTEIVDSFRDHVLAVAVGKVTAEALSEEGIERIISPKNERMGAMIIELAQYFDSGLTR